MLKEFTPIRQEATGYRRNFCDESYDLYAWYDDQKRLTGFQLVYGQDTEQKALTWTEAEGYSHNSVDEGDDTLINQSPILVPDGVFAPQAMLQRLLPLLDDVDPAVRALVLDKIRTFRI